MKKHLIKIIYIILLTLIACDNSSEKNNSENNIVENDNLVEITKSQYINSNMSTGIIEPKLFKASIKTNGYINVPPASKASVSTIMGGFVKKANLLVGDKVKKGQLLLTIQNPEFIEIQQQYLEIVEELNYLESEFERQKTLFKEKITSHKNYLKAEVNLKKSKAICNGLEEKLGLMNINTSNVKLGKITSIIPVYAPISGIVSMVNTSVGKYMNTSEVLLEIIDDQKKHLELIVFEKDVMSLKKGQQVNFKSPENSSKIYNGEVDLIANTISKESRSVKVHVHLKESKSFIVGMYMEAEIVKGLLKKMALPASAVIQDNGKAYIMVLNKENPDTYLFEKTVVSIGVKNEDFVEILENNLQLRDKQILLNGVFIP